MPQKWFILTLLLLMFGYKKSIGQQCMNCKMLNEIIQCGQFRQRKAREVFLVDTFGFFRPAVYKLSDTSVLKVLSDIAGLPPNAKFDAFYVAIATGRENALAIGLYERRSNCDNVYYFSIFGKEIKIIKRTGGCF